MSRIRGSGNKATELRLTEVFRAHGITGWRRGCSLALTPRSIKSNGSSARRPSARPNNLEPMTHYRRRLPRVRPDFVFPRLRVAVFVDGCFWHGCPKHATQPKTNAAFWRDKIAANRARDRRVNHVLRALGWRVLRIWEHDLKRRAEPALARRLHRTLTRHV